MKINKNTIRSSLHMQSFEYSTKDYPFKEILEKLYGCELNSIHKFLGSYDQFERANDQSTLAHKVFYGNFNEKTFENQNDEENGRLHDD